jgi:DNA-binding CsgD family transcriptional regulator
MGRLSIVTQTLHDERGLNPMILADLTPRQHQLALLAGTSSFSNKELGVALRISEGTVKNLLHAVYEKLGVDGRMALMLLVGRNGNGHAAPK